MKRLFSSLVCAIVLVLGAQSKVFADQLDLDRELINYVSAINGSDFEAAKLAMETLRWSGVSEPRVYDPIAEKLTELKDSKAGDERKRAAWYAKALGFSGNEKYRPLLESVLQGSSHKNVKKYATIGLRHLDNHRSWNPIISQGVVAAPAGQLEETRIANMLGAKNYELMRLGAKRVTNSFKGHQDLIEVAAQKLKQEWQGVDESNGPQVDGVAWLIRAVGTGRDTKHDVLLKTIVEQSDLKKIRKYAKKALKK